MTSAELAAVLARPENADLAALVRHIVNQGEIITTLRAERDAAVERAERRERDIEAALVGGNHLASLLVHRLGPDFPERFPITEDPREIGERMGYSDDFDVWCGWRAFMRLRTVEQGGADG